MASLTITLDDDVFAELQERASAADAAPEAVAAALVTSCLSSGLAEEVSPETAEIIERQVKHFQPLFERLAQ